jgi:flavodoxin
MKFKMRILYFSPAGNAERLATEIARAQQAGSDKIPPAYPVEKEKLVFIGVELKGASADKAVVAFCQNLTPARTKYAAFYAVGGGDFSGVNELKQIVSSKGINVVGSIHQCTVKGGLFSKGSVGDADIKAAVAWADQVVNSLAGV